MDIRECQAGGGGREGTDDEAVDDSGPKVDNDREAAEETEREDSEVMGLVTQYMKRRKLTDSPCI